MAPGADATRMFSVSPQTGRVVLLGCYACMEE
jgi:hypothetical protein